MKGKSVIVILFVCFFKIQSEAVNFPGPRVYVVTPSARPKQNDDGKFYYHKWIRRMDTGPNTTITTTTTPAPKVKTPDLIFAEFESDGSMQKSIRKLLEKERITPKPSTMSPIYVPDSEENKVTRVVNYGLPVKVENHAEVNSETTSEKTDYTFMFSDNNYNNVPAPIYLPTTKAPTTKITTTTTTTEKSPIRIENIWNIIDHEKFNEYSGNWQEVSQNEKSEDVNKESTLDENQSEENFNNPEDHTEITMDDNFALPGFGTTPGSAAENESRAIRTEPVMRFPYVNLKPFQMKAPKNPSFNSVASSKKRNNLLTSLDHFTDLKYPVRGEVQDILPAGSQIDRYNPAQPYLPQPNYGTKNSRQSSKPDSAPGPQKATAMLVPPPPPPSKVAGDDFPAPVSYDSFPPYAPSGPDFGPAIPAAPPSPTKPASPSYAPPASVNYESFPPYAPSAPDFGPAIAAAPPLPTKAASPPYAPPASALDTSDSSDSDDDPQIDIGYRYKPPMSSGGNDNSPMMGMGYQYKPPAPPVPQFIPTPAPQPKPFAGYSYNRPSADSDSSMMVADKPDFQGYQYNKPEPAKPVSDYMPPSYGSPPSYGPEPSDDHDDSPPHGHDYPELSFNKPHDDAPSDDMKESDMGMMVPPPPSADTKPDSYGPPDDHGFPHDFPTDFKFHHDFDEHDHDHFHYTHPTTTTTEMPRVNRFSYYYLGKKLYYLPLYFSVYFIVYVGALIIKAVLRHKIVYPNSWRPNTTTATFFSKRSVDEYLSNDNLHHLTRKVTHALATAAEKYMNKK